MQTKIEAGKIATSGGTHMVIASRLAHPLKAIAGGARCTWFLTPANPVTARKKWIAGSLEPKGILTIDAGAVAALRSGKSLLPAGVIQVDGVFARGDAVVIRGPDGVEVARGLVAYDAEDAGRISAPRPTFSRSSASAAAPRWCTGTTWWSGEPDRIERREAPGFVPKEEGPPTRRRRQPMQGNAPSRQSRAGPRVPCPSAIFRTTVQKKTPALKSQGLSPDG